MRMTSSLRRTGLVPSLLRSFDEKMLTRHRCPAAAGRPASGPCRRRLPRAPRARSRGSAPWCATLVVLDFLAAAVAGLLALLVRFGTEGPSVYLLVTLAAPVVWVLSCASVRAYEQRFLGTGQRGVRARLQRRRPPARR